MIVEQFGQPWRDRRGHRAERLRPGTGGGPVTGQRRAVQQGQEEVSSQRSAAEQGESDQQSDGSRRGGRRHRTRHSPYC
ncbi:hypothetical protein Pen02_22020 [Plantactinospora endophytica]|uniref:Uncharacterized protein n=1 Tax=Plantactinospora endophytica TaxID=673535 RepID=A0ABQ4DXV1_9ACTN|nr:hypothetical protein Pen02_22020 [Plantactinospora endophytica]